MPTIVIATGPGRGENVRVDQSSVTLGRHADCTVQVIDDAVSRNHARVFYDHEAGAHAVEDTGSANGTTVNGEKLSGPVALTDGDVITVGQTELCYLSGDFDDPNAMMAHLQQQRWFGEADRATLRMQMPKAPPMS